MGYKRRERIPKAERIVMKELILVSILLIAMAVVGYIVGYYVGYDRSSRKQKGSPL